VRGPDSISPPKRRTLSVPLASTVSADLETDRAQDAHAAGPTLTHGLDLR